MTKFFGAALGFALFLGATGQLKHATIAMAGLAAHAFQHDQISYAKFTRALTHCDIGTPEYASRECARYRKKLTKGNRR